MQYRVIDADSHVNEPAGVWQDRIPAAMRERAPKMIPLKDGKVGWSLNGGARVMPVGLQAIAGFDVTQYDFSGMPYDKIRKGSYDPRARIEDMDFEIVQAQVIYPGVALTGARNYGDDREMQLACVQAYNDWILEFNAHAPERLIGLPIMPSTGIEDLILEWKRVAKKGARGIIISAYPNGSPGMKDEDERFWSEVEEWPYPVHIHFGFFGGVTRTTTRPGGVDPVVPFVNRMGVGVYTPLAELIYFGVFERHPKLKVVAVETGIGWIPFFLETIDDNFLRHRWHSNTHLKRMPSDYFKEHVWATFVADVHGLENRHKIGIEHIMWSTDFPHVQTDWPNSQRVISYEFRGIPEDERQKILWKNAANLYQLG